MLFQKNSTRTRLSFEAGMTELGGYGIFLDVKTIQFSLTDFRDKIQAVMRFGDTLMFRSLKADDILTVASFNKISVINACSEKHHPCQALDDIFTMLEDAGGIDNIKSVAWLGIENNILNILKIACAKLDIKVNIIALEIDPNSVDQELNKQANVTGNQTVRQLSTSPL